MASVRAESFIKQLESDSRTRIMGIVNCTPDSFYAPSRLGADAAALDAILEQNPDIIDLGAESTRPGSLPIDPETQIARLGPALTYIRSKSDIPISIDTRSCSVAKAMVELGADLINDVSSLTDDSELEDFVLSQNIPVILMHKQGTPLDMQKNPTYEKVCEEIIAYLVARATSLEERGLDRRYIFLDPGIGFGKTLEQNQEIVSRISDFVATGYKIVFGHSRKAFIGRLLGGVDAPVVVEERGFASAVLSFFAAQKGCSLVRVHDIGLTREALSVDNFVKGGK